MGLQKMGVTLRSCCRDFAHCSELSKIKKLDNQQIQQHLRRKRKKKEDMSLLLKFPHHRYCLSSSPFFPLSYLSTPQKIFSFSTKDLTFQSPSLRFLPTPKKLRRGRGMVCYSSLPPNTLQWVCAVSSAVLMLMKDTAIQKSFLVPLFVLQAPSSVISWIKGEYGGWSSFLALLVRLFYFIPGELELPLLALLLAIVAPYQAMNLRGTEAGAIISLAISGFLALQHFSKAGGLQKALDQKSIIATIAIICITAVPCLLFF